MELASKLTLKCPIRGELKASKKSKDGLTPTEEYFRVEAIKHLIKQGYPKDNFTIEAVIARFGNGGRNSFRSDFAILDVPASSIDASKPDELLKHALLICEVKKDNAKADYVKHTQVRPILDFAKTDKCIGLYWDNIEQRVFWQEKTGGVRETKEGPLSFLPAFGDDVKTKPITFEDTLPSDSLLDTFGRIEDILHTASFDPGQRYEIILQLLLTKIFDEHEYETRPKKPMGVQDYAALGNTPSIGKSKFEDIVSRAISFYEKHLPNKLPKTIPIKAETLAEILQILAPLRIIHSKRDVVQTFYMKFAKDLYKWDLAQFFTPTTVTDFIVETLNPRFGEHVCDPACGSADFLVAAFRIIQKINPGYADCVWGVDNSANAVQISVLNMLLNGDGKTNIKKDDSLEHVDNYLEKYDLVVCNPPFGTKIKEKRPDVLKKFDLGHEWAMDAANGDYTMAATLVDGQETGLLFIEACVKQCKAGGRIAIILPNGYLGNRSGRYRVAREWLLKHTRLAALVAFPRFTFKTSGADVSTTVIFVEKRATPLTKLSDDSDYSFAVEMIEKVGWDAANKKAAPIYRRNSQDGSYFVDEEGGLIIDSDFKEAMERIRSSKASEDFSWLNSGQDTKPNGDAWAINISQVLADPDLTLDAKRYSRKVITLRNSLEKEGFVKLGDIVDFIPEKYSSTNKQVKLTTSTTYKYIELSNIGWGEYDYEEVRGWALPSRARHFTEDGDIYFGAIWGSVSKWCYIGRGVTDAIVTNGCHRVRMKKGKEEYLLDLLAYINTEGWGAQMRSMARGSDGLAEISIDDAKQIIIPVLADKALRNELQPFIDNLKESRFTINNTIALLLSSKKWKVTEPQKRHSHIVLV